MSTSKKTGVLLIQLGTPDSPSVFDVARYLREFLSDPRVVDLPSLVRFILVNGIIVPFRSRKSSKAYKQLWALSGGESPLLTYTSRLKELLQERFSQDDYVNIEIGMRYQSPSMMETIERMKLARYDHIMVLPLFPQYASATTGSAVERALNTISKWWVIPEISVIGQFYDHPSFIEAIIDQSRPFPTQNYDHILFSFHGLPVRHLDKTYSNDLCSEHPCSDEVNQENQFCYKATCFETARLVATKLGLSESAYTVCFQSRLNGKWMEPFADMVIRDLAKKGAKKLLVFSPAFVSDCLETLIEISHEYQSIFEESGGELIQLVPGTNDNPKFIDCLEDLVRSRIIKNN